TNAHYAYANMTAHGTNSNMRPSTTNFNANMTANGTNSNMRPSTTNFNANMTSINSSLCQTAASIQKSPGQVLINKAEYENLVKKAEMAEAANLSNSSDSKGEKRKFSLECSVCF